MIKKKRKKDGLHLTDKKHPKQGIASTILGLLSLVLFLVLCNLSGQAGGNAGIWIGIWGVVLAVINIWGFVLGMISLKLENITPAKPQVTVGDINCDGEVDIIDAGIIVQYANGINTNLS